jgi:HEAT repeat protein
LRGGAWRKASGGVLAEVCIALGCIAALAGGIWGARAYMKAREARFAAVRELRAADLSRMEKNLQESRVRREVEEAARDERTEQAIKRALDKINSNSSMSQCDGALELGRLNAREHIDTLKDVLWSEKRSNVRNCAAGALVRLGEKSTALAAYVQWAGGSNSDLRRAAIHGFGDIGPEAAEQAMPFLTEALKSQYIDERMAASLAISKVQPQAAQGAAPQ